MTEFTLEQVDAALKVAHERGIDEADQALLWFTRATLTGVELKAEHLCLVMGMTLDRAEELVAILSERGQIDMERTAACPATRQAVEASPASAGNICVLCGELAESHEDAPGA